jgi:hypothetical protein
MKVEVVIPLGNGDPTLDTPDIAMMIAGLRNIKDQSIPVSLCIAVDAAFDKRKLEIAAGIADRVFVGRENGFWRDGSGMWLDIWEAWKSSDAQYVAWNGYDDYSALDRFELQLDCIQDRGGAACFCSTRIDNAGQLRTLHNGRVDFVGTLRRHSHTPFMGGYLLNRELILNSGMEKWRDKWAWYWEGLLFAYIMYQGLPCVAGTWVAYREHPATITETWRKKWVQDLQAKYNYSRQDMMTDWEKIGFAGICDDIGGLYD